jgi:type III pantothenate kinase
VDGLPDRVIFGSVVPALDAKIKTAVKMAFGVEALQVGPQSPLGIKLKVRTPGQVGADRVLNALAAKNLFPGKPVIVIDFGTATTFDCVDAAGDYLGGAILLGPNSAARALHEFTAKLPLVKVRKPAAAVGKDTVECLEAGLYFGYLGMIREVLARTKREMRGAPRVVATGGLASLFLKDLPGVRHDPDLTLHGLRIAAEMLHNNAR